MTWKKGDRVYVHGKDLFGRCGNDEEDGKVNVKLDLPWDPKAPSEEVEAEKLEDACTVRRRYE